MPQAVVVFLVKGMGMRLFKGIRRLGEAFPFQPQGRLVFF
jgi:hypothetical protein